MLDPVDYLVPGPLYMAAGLAAVTVLAFRRRASRGTKVALVALTAWAWIFATPGFSNALVAWLEGPEPAERDVARDEGSLVVVLGSGKLYAMNGKPNPRLDESGWERIRTGIALWKKTGGRLLLTGGPAGEEMSIAAVMRDVAIESGIPAQVISVSAYSRTTYEDLSQAAARIAPATGHAWLVTSARHMPRALAVARKLRLGLRPYPCDFLQVEAPTWRIWLPDNGAPTPWTEGLHELAGLWYYRLRGWAE